MLLSQPKIPEVGSEFLTVESLKEAAQQGAKVAGFAFSVSLSKLSHSKKVQKVAYAKEMNIVEEAFGERNGKRIQNVRCIYIYKKLPTYGSSVNTTSRRKSWQSKKSNRDSKWVRLDPFILNNMRFEQLVRKISKWAIDQIKGEICETEKNNKTNDSFCKYRLQLNFKLLCHHIIPSTGLIPLSIIYPC
ncbi:11703_t:CDS:2 [Gigaspora rosea]|nr:11703_t:CDS:2 [Gigaspora rosea]